MKKAHVLEYREVVRRLFRETFGIKYDHHFVNHESVSEETVQDYADELGDGPDDDNLHFHVEKGHENVWNKEVLKLLLQKLNASLDDEEESLRGPTPSDAYWMELLENKYDTLRKEWKAGMKRKKADGSYETDNDVRVRWHEMRDVKGINSRKGRRRRDVRELLLFVDTTNNGCAALRKPTPHCKCYHCRTA
jgi:hypothetical protein